MVGDKQQQQQQNSIEIMVSLAQARDDQYNLTYLTWSGNTPEFALNF